MRASRPSLRAVAVAAFALFVTACSSQHGASSAGGGGGAASAMTCSLAQPAPPDWRLRTKGTTFRDGLGRIVTLRGVNGGGRSKFSPNMPFDFTSTSFDTALAAYMDRAEGWGIDTMRVPFVWAAVEPTQGTDDADFLSRYDALLAAAWAHGIRTVIDFHQDVYSESYCGDGFPAWTLPGTPPPPMHDCADWQLEYFDDADVKSAFDRFWASGSTVQADFVALWKRMATRYASTPGVLGFEVINEPASGTADGTSFEQTTLPAFYTSRIAELQAIAPEALVFIDPLGEDGAALQTSLARPAGDGIVFAPHFYPLLDDPTQVVKSLQESWVPVGASWDVPVWVGEFGLSRDATGAEAYLSGVFDAFDQLGLSGSLWEYSVASEEWNDETDSIVAADGTEYPVAAAVIRPFARAVAADAFTSGFDTTSQTFTLSYAPSGDGVTEVSLPARAYPSGFDVALEGACVDTSHAGELLIQPTAGAAKVQLTVTPK